MTSIHFNSQKEKKKSVKSNEKQKKYDFKKRKFHFTNEGMIHY